MGKQPGRGDEEDSRDCAKLQLHRDGKCFILDLFVSAKGFWVGKGNKLVLGQEMISPVPDLTKLEVVKNQKAVYVHFQNVVHVQCCVQLD